MPRLGVFEQISLDGLFADDHGDMSWAHRPDPEWSAFTAENASRGGALVFGRVTYELMARYWPTAAARAANPAVAEHMTQRPKIVFSRTLGEAAWENTTVLADDPAVAMRRLKAEAGPDMVILGSGSIVAQLTDARLVDKYQVVLNPIVLGGGRSMFEGSKRLDLKLQKTRAFTNGNVVLWYEPR
jgi:dihydrofolate reductase